MQELFNLIVDLFEYICQITGLRYAELNILVYCLLIPLTWAIIVAYRNRKYMILPTLHIIAIYFYLSFRGELNILSRQLYERNVMRLELFGNQTLDGYMYISLLIGVLAPIVMYSLLFFLPKQKITWLYFLYILALFVYEIWVWQP